MRRMRCRMKIRRMVGSGGMGYEREDEDETGQRVLKLKSLNHLQNTFLDTYYLATTFGRMTESGGTAGEYLKVIFNISFSTFPASRQLCPEFWRVGNGRRRGELSFPLKPPSHLQLVLINTFNLATTFRRMVESGETE